MTNNEREQEIKTMELCENINEYKFQYGIKIK